MTRPLRVFLCHASQDKPAVRRLHRYLKQHGIEPWLDELDLLPGENWEVEIPRALYASDVILVCLSKNSINKEGYVQKEISFALDKALEKPDGTIFIIPAKLEDCEVPNRLNRYQWVDLFRPDSNKRLLRGLNKRALDLGSDVSPVVLEDTRQRNPTPKPKNQDALEKVRQLAKEKSEREVAEKTQRAKEEQEADRIARENLNNIIAEEIIQENVQREAEEKLTREKSIRSAANFRRFGMGGIMLIVFIFGGFGLNYLIKNLPVATATPQNIPTADLSTSTSIPFTPTTQPTETLIPTPILDIGSTEISPKDGMVLLYVPAGEFVMGSDSSDQTDERPAHTVYLDAFWIDQTEVTNEMYAKCVGADTCTPPSYHFSDSSYANHPVVYVNWNMAKTYCKWAGRDLPTEAQWEKAARGTDGRTYPWGENINCDRANYKSSCVGDTSPVGSYESGKSSYNAYDMVGNVWEWTNDWYSETYYQSSPLSNPLGPASGTFHVLRGGSWNVNSHVVRSAYRDWITLNDTYLVFGFRCARLP